MTARADEQLLKWREMKNWESAEVDKQLRRVLASPELATSPKLTRLLRYIVEHSTNGGSGKVKQYELAVEGLGYEPDFDPGTNPTVRIMVRRLRRALKRYYENSGSADPIVMRIPKGGYNLEVSANTKQSSRVSASPTEAQAALRSESLAPSIAVVGFDCLNNRDTCTHIATGLTEEIIIALARFSKFQVTGPLNRATLEKEGMDATAIGRRFGARFVLDGSIRSNSSSFRLSVRLVDTASGHQLWGEVLDSGLKSEEYLDFDNHVVSRVASTVAESHGVIPTLLLEESQKRGNKDLSSYEAILHYYNYNRHLNEDSYVHAVGGLEQAVNDPAANTDATVYGMLSDLVAESWLFGMTDDESVLDRAEQLARKALSIDPSNQSARFSMALVHALRYDRDAFLEEADHALRLNPHNAVILAATAVHLTMAGEQTKGMRLIKKASMLNPHHPSWYHIIPCMISYLEGDYESALIHARKFSTEGFYWDPLIRAAVLGCLGRQSQASRAADELLALVPDFGRRGRSLIRRLVFLEENVEALVGGLLLAGLDIEP